MSIALVQACAVRLTLASALFDLDPCRPATFVSINNRTVRPSLENQELPCLPIAEAAIETADMEQDGVREWSQETCALLAEVADGVRVPGPSADKTYAQMIREIQADHSYLSLSESSIQAGADKAADILDPNVQISIGALSNYMNSIIVRELKETETHDVGLVDPDVEFVRHGDKGGEWPSVRKSSGEQIALTNEDLQSRFSAIVVVVYRKSHYVTLLVRPRSQEILCADSLRRERSKVPDTYLTVVRPWIRSLVGKEEWRKWRIADMPSAHVMQQGSSADCGAYAAFHALSFAAGTRPLVVEGMSNEAITERGLRLRAAMFAEQLVGHRSPRDFEIRDTVNKLFVPNKLHASFISAPPAVSETLSTGLLKSSAGPCQMVESTPAEGRSPSIQDPIGSARSKTAIDLTSDRPTKARRMNKPLPVHQNEAASKSGNVDERGTRSLSNDEINETKRLCEDLLTMLGQTAVTMELETLTGICAVLKTETTDGRMVASLGQRFAAKFPSVQVRQAYRSLAERERVNAGVAKRDVSSGSTSGSSSATTVDLAMRSYMSLMEQREQMGDSMHRLQELVEG